MFEVYENTICVHGGWLYSEQGANIMSVHSYKNYLRRGPFRVMRNGGGKNTPAHIAWESIQPHYQQQIIENYGDPTQLNNNIIFIDHLTKDHKAEKFYSSYILPNGKHIANDVRHRYVSEASIFNATKDILENRILKTAALGSGGVAKTWESIAQVVQELPRIQWPHGLPKNPRSLRRKYRAYIKEGYEALVHRGHGHKNSEKMSESAKLWVMARWCDQVKKVASLEQLLDEYNEYARDKGHKVIKESKTLYNYLYQPEVKSLWYGYRYGELKAKEKYQFQNSTKMPTMRDSLWYADGTKLNLYYKDESGKMATCNVYEVMDAFSEVFLGFHISQTENYEAQYKAFKMAVNTSGHRPYEVRFDNQGGHKKLKAGQFMDKLTHLAIKTQPYNGKSKTIESAFGRFQQQVMKKLWYFTGQNIDTKKAESKANMEFILANTENLPSLKEAIEVYKECREQWNQAKHYDTNRPRIDMYLDSKNPKAPELDMFQMVDIFWMERPKPVRLTAYGLTFTDRKTKHTYMVYNDDHLPDLDFLNNNIDRKFHIKYDPEDLTLVYLYEKVPGQGLRFVTEARTKLQTARNIQEQEKWEAEYYSKIASKVKENRLTRRDQMDEIMEKFSRRPQDYGLNPAPLKGIEKKKRKGSQPTKDIAQIQKDLSNTTPDGDESIYDLM